MKKLAVPRLTFDCVELGGSRIPWDLSMLLYVGGAETPIHKVGPMISDGLLGPPISQRLPLVVTIHEILLGKLTGGGSVEAAKTEISTLRNFYAFMDKTHRSARLETIESDFIAWTDHLIYRQRIQKNLRAASVYHLACCVGRLLDRVLGLKTGIIRKTRITYRSVSKELQAASRASKQNLNETFSFGHFLLDICDALTVDSIRGSLPIRIGLRNGYVLEEWSGLQSPENLAWASEQATSIHKSRAIKTRLEYEQDVSARTRHPLMNLRVEAELLIFLAQTGMNLAQAHKLRVGNFSYQSYHQGYKVRRVFKNRRKGPVEFEIYTEYRVIFDRYLAWRKTMFFNNEMLFPLWTRATVPALRAPDFLVIRKRCKKLGIPFFGPHILRAARQNWLLRRSRDPAVTAEMGQHDEETLLNRYRKPNHQEAVVEISQFHRRTDPAIAAPGPGKCVEDRPEPIRDIPADAPPPDCGNPAGCLFCLNQRDLNTQDHVWSLASYRHLKTLELARYRLPKSDEDSHPACLVIKRINAKLAVFEALDSRRSHWVTEAVARVDEGYFHPKWNAFIQLMEIRR